MKKQNDAFMTHLFLLEIMEINKLSQSELKKLYYQHRTPLDENQFLEGSLLRATDSLSTACENFFSHHPDEGVQLMFKSLLQSWNIELELECLNAFSDGYRSALEAWPE